MSEDVTLDEFKQNEQRSESKPEWQKTKLEDLLSELLTGGRPTGGGLDEGEYISIGGTQINSEGYIDLQDLVYIPEEYFDQVEETQLQKHDILVVKDGANTGDVAIAWQSDDQIVTNEHLFTLRTDSSINPPYLFYYLLSHQGWKQINGTITGSAQEGINRGFTGKVDIKYPSISEQRKIATVLYTLDRAIEKTEEITEQAHTVKNALMQDVFHGRHKSFEDYQSTPVGEIPTHWSVVSIGDVVHTAQYGISESLSEEGQYPIFRMNNIENGKMVDEPLKYIDLDNDEFEKYRVECGDILFNRTNSLDLVGKTGIYELEGDHVFASYLVRLKTNSRADSHYLNYYMNSSEAQNRMMDFATKGVSQANINANSIQQVKLPLPPVEEQKEIADRLSSIDSQIEANDQYMSQLKRLKRGLMQDLLSGKVRTTDTNIEVPEEVAQHG